MCPEKTWGQKGSAVSKSRVLSLSLLPHCAEAREGILVLSTPETPGGITASMSARISSPIAAADLFKVKMRGTYTWLASLSHPWKPMGEREVHKNISAILILDH